MPISIWYKTDSGSVVRTPGTLGVWAGVIFFFFLHAFFSCFVEIPDHAVSYSVHCDR